MPEIVLPDLPARGREGTASSGQAILVARRLQADDVLEALTELFVRHGPPAHIRSDNGPEFTATVVRGWLKQLGVRTLFITPASPWENGYNESFNGTLG